MNRVHDVPSLFRAMNQLEFTFNWFYADDRDIAMFSSGRLPVRAAGVGTGLPTNGSGQYEWRGFEPLRRHARGTDGPRNGVILNWNNKPARGFSASDDNWSFGPVQRVQLLVDQVAKRGKHTLATLVAAMNAAATQDLGAVAVLPVARHHGRLDEGRCVAARPRPRRQHRRSRRGDHGRGVAGRGGRRDATDAGPAHGSPEVAGLRGRSGQLEGPRITAGGTATSSAISTPGHRPSAVTAISSSAARGSGRRSRPPERSSRRPRGPTRAGGVPTRRASVSGSASSR